LRDTFFIKRSQLRQNPKKRFSFACKIEITFRLVIIDSLGSIAVIENQQAALCPV
jgi:hypothetical protein